MRGKTKRTLALLLEIICVIAAMSSSSVAEGIENTKNSYTISSELYNESTSDISSEKSRESLSGYLTGQEETISEKSLSQEILEETSTEETSTEETSTEETSAEETSAEETSAEETSAEEETFDETVEHASQVETEKVIAEKSSESESVQAEILLLDLSETTEVRKNADGTLALYKDGRIDSGFNGFFNYENVWYYFKEGKTSADFTGLFKGTINGKESLWYCVESKVDFKYSSLYKFDGIWWYCNSGSVDYSYTGLVEYKNVLFYIENGQINWKYNSLCKYDGIWWCCRYGQVDKAFKGLCEYKDTLFYVENGQVNWKFSSLFKYQDIWWYCKYGQVDKTYKGFVLYKDVLFYIEDGQINWKYNSLCKYDGIWWYCRNGQIDKSYTGLCEYKDTLFYVDHGKINWGYYGLYKYNGIWWRLQYGQVDKTFTGLCEYNGVTFYIEDGKVNFGYTGFIQYNGNWYYIKAGHLESSDSKLINGVIYKEIKSIAHRGYSDIAPENTLAAYRLAKEKGFKYVECDISFTSDNIPVLLHDRTIDRTSNGSGKISEMTFDEVRNYDFGSWKSSKYLGEKIPSLEEFLNLCVELELYPYIEIKAQENVTSEQINKIMSLVKASGIKERCSIISFDMNYLSDVKDLEPEIRLGCLTSSMNSELISAASVLKTSKNEVFINSSAYDKADVELVRKESLPMEVWTLNSMAKIDILHPYITGVTSNWILLDKMYTKDAFDWYVKKGQVQTGFTGIAYISGVGYYIENGKFKLDFTGKITYAGKSYNVVNGKCQ